MTPDWSVVETILTDKSTLRTLQYKDEIVFQAWPNPKQPNKLYALIPWMCDVLNAAALGAAETGTAE